MSDASVKHQAPSTSESAQALAAFDQARDVFLAAFAQAPDEALPYVPPGEEYALGILPVHLQDSIHDYMDLFARIVRTDFASFDMSADADAAEKAEASARHHRALAEQRPTGAERAGMLTDLARTHESVRARFAPLDDVTFTRQAQIVFSAGGPVYPTSARDLVGWMTDHYNEHTQQAGELLTRWRAQGRT
ncbi:MAG: DinB family protein [Ktedonobacterales bacterium]